MAGGAANESYCVDNVGDVVNEDAAGGTGGASRFATRTSKPALTASDFAIV